ncbi:antibiotic biosynthesis monooxygenase [Nocardioides endophyticus]|uniref:Antibiotic biosynthesis monooxygenase n=1 Tax=Nocardioides endophyticus TaxID=1353775 RepID=A0ABP8YDE8_9ACTN
MAITKTLELHFKPEALDDARTVVRRALKETRAFDGNLGVNVLVDRDDRSHWILYERWESQEHNDAYHEFRAGPGVITDLGPLLAGPPAHGWFTIDDSI